MFTDRIDTDNRFIQLPLILLTYIIICFTWVLFRAENMNDAFTMLNAMTGGQTGSILPDVAIWKIGILSILLLSSHWLLREMDFKTTLSRLPLWFKSAAVAVIILCLTLVSGDERAFIYFQF